MKKKQDIKSFGPRTTKVSKQGYFIPSRPEKYIGNPKIIFRSSWEFRFMQWCDTTPTVVRWSSEPIGIPYFNPLDRKVHTYFVDFYVAYTDSDGNEKAWLVEVKPTKYIQHPKAPERMTEKQTANYLWAAKQYIINKAKFEAAKEYASGLGIGFGIITENFLFNAK